jgi:general secretion pathway protein B
MSFILDALKKSELERQRQSGPGLLEIPVATRRRRVPVWAWALAGLLFVNVAVLLFLLLRGGAEGQAHTATNGGAQPTHAGQRGSALPGAAAQGAAAADHFSPMDSQPVYAPEIPVPEEGAGSAIAAVAPSRAAPMQAAPMQSATNLNSATTRAAPLEHTARSADAAGGRADAGRAAGGLADPVLNDDPPDEDELLPSIAELNLSGSQALPEIHLDVHVYASRPADRFVYINMRKYREGAVLQEGPTLERIRRNGVVLNYHGLRFLVPRQ